MNMGHSRWNRFGKCCREESSLESSNAEIAIARTLNVWSCIVNASQQVYTAQDAIAQIAKTIYNTRRKEDLQSLLLLKEILELLDQDLQRCLWCKQGKRLTIESLKDVHARSQGALRNIATAISKEFLAMKTVSVFLARTWQSENIQMRLSN